MADITVSTSRFVAASPELVYEALADYAGQHPRILPEEFSDYRVEAGGHGAGTIISVKVTLQGGARTMRMLVSEPEPGRVLVETDAAAHTETRFTVDAASGGSKVTIDTTFLRSRGLRGVFEALVVPRMLRGLYAKELDRLAAHLGR